MSAKIPTIVHIDNCEVIALLQKHGLLDSTAFDAWLLNYLKVHDIVRDIITPKEPTSSATEAVAETKPETSYAISEALANAVNAELLDMKYDMSRQMTDIQKVYTNTLEKLQTVWNVSSVAGDRTVQELSTLQERVNRIYDHLNTSHNDVNSKLDSILGKSGVGSAIKGEAAETVYIQSLLREFPEAIITDVSKTSHTCDIQITRQANQPRVFIELKHYTQPVPTQTIKKFENDLSHYDHCGGIFVSATSSITGKTAFHIEMKGTNVLVFISNAGLVDVKCIRHAIQAIDILQDLANIQSDNNENAENTTKKYAIQLDDEQCSLIANEIRMYDQRQIQIVSTLQHVISDIKAQTLSVLRKIILDRAIPTPSGQLLEERLLDQTRCLACNNSFKTVSNLNRHLRNGTCAAKKGNSTSGVIIPPEDLKVAEAFFAEEMEVSRGYGCVNVGLLKKQLEKWCAKTGQSLPATDTRSLFNDILGAENWSSDGVCGRVHSRDQLRSWTGKVAPVTPNDRINLRVHNGWRGYKLKNGASCEMKRNSKNTETSEDVSTSNPLVTDDTEPACP